MNVETMAASPAETGIYEPKLPLSQIVASKTNPRKHFPDAYLDELALSISEKGLIQPIVVRPNGKAHSFEIVAGECRYRASKRAGLQTLPAIIRTYTDEQTLEVQLIENIHRTDLTPLEQAVGYRALISANPDKHSAATIAQRIGMSEAWVWDRLKLNDLVAEAKQILEQERMTVGHAILIARLKPEDQERAIAFDDDASTQYRGVGSNLWREDAGFDFDELEAVPSKGNKRSKWEGLKACSVRELERWINDHVRFDVAHAAKAQPLTFEPLASKVEEAEAKPGRGRKVIAITFDHFTQPDARSGEERTYGPKSFKFADGEKHTDDFPRRTYTAAPCDYTVLGVVAAGDRRGQSFDVCIARDRCEVHWKKEIAARAKNQKLRESGQSAKAARREANAREAEARQEAKDKAARERWDAYRGALHKAATAAAVKLPAALPRKLFAAVVRDFRLPAATTPAKLQKALLAATIEGMFRHAWRDQEAKLTAFAKLLGVDVKACEPPKPEQPKKAKS